MRFDAKFQVSAQQYYLPCCSVKTSVNMAVWKQMAEAAMHIQDVVLKIEKLLSWLQYWE